MYRINLAANQESWKSFASCNKQNSFILYRNCFRFFYTALLGCQEIAIATIHGFPQTTHWRNAPNIYWKVRCCTQRKIRKNKTNLDLIWNEKRHGDNLVLPFNHFIGDLKDCKIIYYALINYSKCLRLVWCAFSTLSIPRCWNKPNLKNVTWNRFDVNVRMDAVLLSSVFVNVSVVVFLVILILLCLKIKTTKKTPELLGTVGTVKTFDEDGLLSQHNDTSTNLSVQHQLNISHNSTGPLVSVEFLCLRRNIDS